MSLSLYSASMYTGPLTLTTMCFSSMAAAYMPFPKDSVDDASCNILDPPKDQIHPREQKLKSLMAPSFFERWFGNPDNSEDFLNLKKEDIKEKFLFLSGEEDHNGALDPQNMLKLLKDINSKYDLKYKIVKSFDEVCQEVKKAAEIGKIGNVLINAHSDSNGLCLSNCKSHEGWLHKFKDYSKCFKEVDIFGKITLFGSKTGAVVEENSKNNVAQKIATDSKREVIAPIGFVSSSGIEIANTKNFELYQKIESTKEENKIFKLFNPEYEECTKITDILHPREKTAAEVVKEETIKNSQLIYHEDFESHVLKLCKDNPRQKFLFLSMEADHNDAQNPIYHPGLFKILSSHYDFKYKVVKSYEEICEQVKEASKTEETINLVINGHGTREGIHISGDSILENWMHIYKQHPRYKDFSCLKSIDSLKRIILLTCYSGQPNGENLNDNIANLIASQTGKEVIAPTERCGFEKLGATSINPIDFTYPSEMDQNENIFKKFHPERVE